MTELTRLGWDVLESSDPRLVKSTYCNGVQRGGDIKVVLDYVCMRWNAEVEKIPKSKYGCWAYNVRTVRGYKTIPSEHSAGVALDLNAPKHPLGVAGTFSQAQVAKIHQILADVDYTVRWGGDYRHAGGDPRRPIYNATARVDEMHIEAQGGLIAIGKVADKIRAGLLPGLKAASPATKPATSTKPAATTPTTQEGDMKLTNTLTRTKDQTYTPGRKGSVKLTDKNTISLAKVSHGDTFRAEAQLYITGLHEHEVVDLRWILVDYTKSETKIIHQFPITQAVGRANGAVVTAEVSVISKVGKKVAAGHDMRVRLYAHNKAGRTITITQARATLERD